MNNQNKSAEQIKSEAELNKSIEQIFGCTREQLVSDLREMDKQIAEFVKKEYPNAK